MTTKIPVELSSTPGIVDGSNATAITIDSSERVGINNSVMSSMDNGKNNLVVGSGSGGQGMTIYSANNAFGTIAFADGTSGDDKYRGLVTYSHSADSLDFYTNATEKMTILSSGNVGIGTSNPGGPLQVQMTHTSTDVTAANSNETLILGNAGSGDGVYNAIKFGGNQQDMYIMSFNDNTQADRRLGFFLGSVAGDAVADERLSIRGNGNVGIGTTSPASISGAAGPILDLAGSNPEIVFHDTAGTANAMSLFYLNDTLYFWNGGTTNFFLSNSGTGAFYGNLGVGDTSPAYRLELPNTASSAGQGRANAWVTYSDSRIKSNIQTLSYGLDIVKQLKPSQYKHHNSIKEDGQFVKQDEGTNDIGFIAQEVLPLIPEVVGIPEDTDKDLYSINYPKLTAVLVKAIQEQQEQIEQLKTEIQTLKGE